MSPQSSSSGSDDELAAEIVGVSADAEEGRAERPKRSRAVAGLAPNEVVWRHEVHKTFHRSVEGSGKSACGLSGRAYAEVPDPPSFLFPRCSRCFGEASAFEG